MNIDNIKKICVVGWGKSGYSLCKLILSLKKQVKLTEVKPAESFSPGLIKKFKDMGVELEFGGHSEDFISDCQLVVLSPGVDPLASGAVAIAKKRRMVFVGEVEFAYWLTKARFVAISGTNGKSTTTFLTYRVLKEKLGRVFLGGNIGIPLSSFVLDTKEGDIIVLEISSFQLETILEFRPYVAAILNVDPNHLDRHPSFEDYFDAKMNIFRNQRPSDWALINETSPLKPAMEKRIKSQIKYFSKEFSNSNYSCVSRIAEIFGINKQECEKVFASFKGLPHRMQLVRKVNDVAFVNDSKSTNPASTIWALKNIATPIILIAGGKDKGVDYAQIIPYLKKVKKINLIGQASEKIKDSLRNSAKIEIYPSLKAVVEASLKDAVSGDTVLFSPMCSSFDMFSNYMDRGRKFVETVKAL
jgi:UDP-N-acetylmuramoylalanine--D-glutamate ligase